MTLWEWCFRRAEIRALKRRIRLLEGSVDYLRATLDAIAPDRAGERRH